MKLFEKMRQQKFLSTTLLLITLSVGIVIGTLVNTSVNAARGQQVAPDATPLVIPHAQEMGSEFTKLAKKMEQSVVNITASRIRTKTATTTGTATAWICSRSSSAAAAGSRTGRP
jgi:serine protease Do